MLKKMIRTQTAQKEKQLDDWMQRHDAAHPFPSETVELTPDLAYAPEKYAKIDVFRPRADFPQPLPVIVDLHGGGFLLGRKEALLRRSTTFSRFCRRSLARWTLLPRAFRATAAI